MNDDLKTDIVKRLRNGFVELGIPEHMREGIELYLIEGIEPGSFLKAVLENNFKEAVARADEINKLCLVRYAYLLYNFFPARAQGSPENVQAWVGQFKRANGEA